MNDQEQVYTLDEESLRNFAQKGHQDERSLGQTGAGNAVKVRRVVQLIKDLAGRPVSESRVLDLACGEGVYSIEIGLRGAEVLGTDARTERMQIGIDSARKNNLSNVTFRQEDVRSISKDSHGEFDVILFLGILYHLDVPASFQVLANLYDMCSRMLIIDTHISLVDVERVRFADREYGGKRAWEHRGDATPDQRQKALLQSIDNTQSFWFTRQSLIQLLVDLGFTSVLECLAPLEPNKAANRVTLVALKGEPVKISTYPWLNELSEGEIAERLQATTRSGKRRNVKHLLRDAANVALRPLGLELQRRSR